MNCEHAHQLLDAYVDGELDTASQQSMQAHLHGCAACAARERERLTLRGALRSLPRPRAPARLRRAVRPPGLSWPGLSRVTLLGWGAIGWTAAVAMLAFLLGHLWPGVQTLEDTIVARHVAALAAARTDDASVRSADRHRVKPWLSGRVGFAPPVPELGAQGFILGGARLEQLGRHDVVAVSWRLRNHAIDLFVWRADAAAAPRRTERWRGFGVVTWADGGLRYAAISDVDIADLERFAAAVSAETTLR